MALAGYKTISMLLLVVVVALASVSPVLATDGVFFVLTPMSGCPGTPVTLEFHFTGGLGTAIEITPPVDLFVQDGFCSVTTNLVRCSLTVGESPCSGTNTITGSADGESAIAYFDVPSTCPGVRSCGAAPVGGCVQPVNTIAMLSPWLAVIGLIGCIGTVVVVAKNRRP